MEFPQIRLKRQAHRGREVFMAENSNKKRAGTLQSNSLLTEREKTILYLVSTGATNGEVITYLSEKGHSIEHDIFRIFQKIGVPNRFQAALWAETNLLTKVS